MPKSVSKVTKHIAKKKGAAVALHAKSRDSKMLLRAGARDARVGRISALREKVNLPYLHRIEFLQDCVADCSEPLDTAQVCQFISEYVERNSSELEDLQMTRRPGRPRGLREVLLKEQREADEREFEAGYWVPDVTDAKTLEHIKKWNGRWVMLNTMRFIRVTRDGEKKESSFPPKGNS